MGFVLSVTCHTHTAICTYCRTMTRWLQQSVAYCIFTGDSVVSVPW